MRTFVWGFADPLESVISRLSKDNIIDIRMWLITKPRDLCTSRQFARKTFFLDSWMDFYRKKVKDYVDSVDFNEDVYNAVYDYYFLFEDFESRYEKKGIKPTHHYLNKFNLMYRFFYSVFVKEKIELCLFSNFPHLGADIILYALAKKMGVKTLFLYQSTIPMHYDKFFYFEDYNDYGDFSFMNKVFDTNTYDIPQLSTKALFYMQEIDEPVKDWKNLFKFNKKSKEYKRYKEDLESLIKPIDYSKKYVYFPLHLQPELTTSILGGKYCDQLLALERLSEFIPDDWKIYVKENPKQNEHMRDSMWFKRFKFIKKVQMAPLEEESSKLIENSQFVSTISGTAGWEAISTGKPVLIFGKTWYQNFEGVFKWDSKPVIENIINSKIDFEKLKKEYNSLLSKMPTGLTDKAYIEAVKDYDKEKMSIHIGNLLEDLILNRI